MKKQCLACQSTDIQKQSFYLIPKLTKSKTKMHTEASFSTGLIVNTLHCRKCHFMALEAITKQVVKKHSKIIMKMIESQK